MQNNQICKDSEALGMWKAANYIIEQLMFAGVDRILLADTFDKFKSEFPINREAA